MGSLTSRPKVPSSKPQVVFVPQPAAAASVAEPTSTTGSESAAGETTAEQSASEVRQQSLLGRERSRFGTVQTSFRGLLGLSNSSGERKTLLGE